MIRLLTETGADLSVKDAAEYNICIVPMHVTMGEAERDDGTFPVTELYDDYMQTGKLPKTSACSPDDFTKAFDALHNAQPDAEILYLAYSAQTTSTYQSALTAAEDREYVTCVDTRFASAGQGLIVLAVAEKLRQQPDIAMSELVSFAQTCIASARMVFIPGDLDYLRAGGRVSNAAYLGARLLHIHPLIEILDGKLVSTRKYRGMRKRVIRQCLRDFVEKYHPSKIRLIQSEGLSAEHQQLAQAEAARLGFAQVEWVSTGCVVTVHCGPGTFGVCGFVPDGSTWESEPGAV